MSEQPTSSAEIPWMILFRCVSSAQIADKKLYDAALLKGAVQSWIYGRLSRKLPMISVHGNPLPIMGENDGWYAFWGASKFDLATTKDITLEMANIIGRVMEQKEMELHLGNEPIMKLERQEQPLPSDITIH